jgi:hypothetical protein
MPSPVVSADISIRIRFMVVRVQHVEGEYRVVLSPEAMEALHLSEGAEVEVRPVAKEQDSSAVQYASTEEVIAAFLETEPKFHNAYLDLAK